MVLWIAAGAITAVAIVIAAVLFRPGEGSGPTEEAATSSEEAEAAAPVTEADAPRDVADPALLPIATVRLRIGPEVSDERREALVTALNEAGIPEVVVEPLPFRIATSRVGYYRDVDLPAAEALARVMSPTIDAGGTIGVRDYGELLSDPRPGRLDLWIGD